MTKPTGVREIIEGIEIEARTSVFVADAGESPKFGPWIEQSAFDKVVAIALELERQRDLLLLGKPKAKKDEWDAKILAIEKESEP